MNAVVKPEDQQVSTSIIAVIERAARDPSIDIDKMERLLAMQERVLTQHRQVLFNESMVAAQAEIGRVSADKENQQTHSTYASYAQLDRHVRPIYTKHGFSLSFGEADSPKAEHVRVTCDVAHVGGFTKPYHTDMPADGKGAKGGDVMTKTHAVGSAKQYGMRYLLKGIFNVAIGNDPDEDDGNRAGRNVDLITEKQVADLDALVTEHGGNKAKLLAYMKLRSFAEIPAENYKFVVDEVKRLSRARADAKAAKEAAKS